MSISIYSPKISRSPIYFPRNGSKPYLRYNHCVDIVPFKNSFLALWNANSTGQENYPGQYNFISRSEDFKSWSAPLQVFSGELCSNPVKSDNQWQPSLINYKDEKVFCLWCDYNAEKTYIAETEDGIHWTNEELKASGKMPENTVAFPTNHGFLCQDGTMIFPLSFPVKKDNHEIGACRYAGILMSRDGGANWEWGGVTEAVLPENVERINIWEPMILESGENELCMLIRNAGEPGKGYQSKTEHCILSAVSKDKGYSWTKCSPVEVESVASRCYAGTVQDGKSPIFMIMNDWQPGIRPETGPEDRLYLSLYLAPLPDPDTLLPGPVVQAEGGRGFYPNAFVKDGKIYCAYTYPDYIMGSVIEELPDFSKAFLMPRESRPGLRTEIEEDRIILNHLQSCMNIVLTPELSAQKRLKLDFRFKSRVRNENDFCVFSAGGKTRDGFKLSLRYDKETDQDMLFAEFADGRNEALTHIRLKEENAIAIELENESLKISINEIVREFSGKLIRKFAFGDLYKTPSWPSGVEPVRDEIQIALSSIEIA